MIYLDTSFAVPLFVPEPHSDAVADWFEDLSTDLVSSDWILPEFSSALAIKVRRGELHQRHAKLAWDEFERFASTGLRLIPVSREAFLKAAEFVRQIRGALRAGDSLHLAMALESGAKGLATTDDELARAAASQGLALTRFPLPPPPAP